LFTAFILVFMGAQEAKGPGIGLRTPLVKYLSEALCRPRRFYQMQVARLACRTDQQVWTGRQFCTLFNTIVQHWTENVSCNYAEINEWPLAQRSLRQMYLCIPLRRTKVLMMHSALLQQLQEPSVIICVSITKLEITTFHAPASFTTCALKFPKTIVDLLDSTLRRASLVSSKNSGYCVHGFGA